jgi:Family of unknown function (DUF6174)
MRKRRLWVGLAVFIVSVVLLGLLFSQPGRLMIIAWHERLWTMAAISHYRYTVRNVSFANVNHLYGVRVEVRDGHAISLVRADTHKPVDPELFAEYATIPQVFVRLRQFVLANPARYWVRYHGATGVPEEISIDFSSSTTDDEYVITITDFEVVTEH